MVLNVQFPRSFTKLLGVFVFANINVLNIFNVGCIWNFNFYHGLLLYTLAPIGLLIVISIGLHVKMEVAYRLNSNHPSYSLKNRNDDRKRIFILIGFVVFSPVSITIFQTFVCDTFEDGSSTLVADSSVSCDSEYYPIYVAYATFMTLLYPIGIPLYYWHNLKHYLPLINPHNDLVVLADEAHLVSEDIIQMEKIKLRNTYVKISGISFLFDSYLPHAWYFEIVECFRRLFLTAIPILFLRSTVFQIVLIELLSLAFCAAYMEYRPFAKKSDNKIAILSQWAITMTVFGSLCLRVDMTAELSFGPGAIGVVLSILNVVIIVLTLYSSVVPDVDDKSIPTRNQNVATSSDEAAAQGQTSIRDRLPPSQNATSERKSISGKAQNCRDGDSDDDSDDEEDAEPDIRVRVVRGRDFQSNRKSDQSNKNPMIEMTNVDSFNL